MAVTSQRAEIGWREERRDDDEAGDDQVEAATAFAGRGG